MLSRPACLPPVLGRPCWRRVFTGALRSFSGVMTSTLTPPHLQSDRHYQSYHTLQSSTSS
jgi:hypothetical protein